MFENMFSKPVDSQPKLQEFNQSKLTYCLSPVVHLQGRDTYTFEHDSKSLPSMVMVRCKHQENDPFAYSYDYFVVLVDLSHIRVKNITHSPLFIQVEYFKI